MSREGQVTRRGFLAGAAGVGIGATVILSRLKPWEALVSITSPSVAQRLAGLIGQRSSARVVGAAYLEAVPEDASVSRLVDGVVAGLPAGRDTVYDVDDDQLRSLLMTRISEDFEQDRMVEVDGWNLSPTEARLYALTALV